MSNVNTRMEELEEENEFVWGRKDSAYDYLASGLGIGAFLMKKKASRSPDTCFPTNSDLHNLLPLTAPSGVGF